MVVVVYNVQALNETWAVDNGDNYHNPPHWEMKKRLLIIVV